MGYEFRVGEQVHCVEPVYCQDKIEFKVDGEVHRVDLESLGSGEYRLTSGCQSRSILMHRDGDRVFLHIDGFDLEIDCENRLDRLRKEARAAHHGGEITAPMPGVVVAVRVEVGESVSDGDPLIVIESMKLQTELAATIAGVVSELPFVEGDNFEKGAVLARLEVPEQDGQK